MNTIEPLPPATTSTTTVDVLGKTYTVAANPNTEDRDMAPYLITSPRGRDYVLIRNGVRPHMLFAMSCSPFQVPRNMWFSDRAGALVHTP